MVPIMFTMVVWMISCQWVYIGLHWFTLDGDREGIVVYGVPGDAGDTGDDNEDYGNNGYNGNDDGIKGLHWFTLVYIG